jgi:hypothetical protein
MARSASLATAGGLSVVHLSDVTTAVTWIVDEPCVVLSPAPLLL